MLADQLEDFGERILTPLLNDLMQQGWQVSLFETYLCFIIFLLIFNDSDLNLRRKATKTSLQEMMLIVTILHQKISRNVGHRAMFTTCISVKDT